MEGPEAVLLLVTSIVSFGSQATWHSKYSKICHEDLISAWCRYDHAAGGVEMMKAARRSWTQAKLIAADPATSTSESQMQWDFQNIQTSLQESVIHHTKDSWSGLWWCRLPRLRKCKLVMGYQFRFYLFDTGNYPAGAAARLRVMTPADAYQIGSDHREQDVLTPKLRILLQLIMLIRMNETKTEMKEIDYKNKRRIPWHLLKIMLATLENSGIYSKPEELSFTLGI